MRSLYALSAVAFLLVAADPPAPITPKRITFATSEIKLKPGRLGKVEVQFTPAEGKAIRWINLSDDLDFIPSESGKSVVVCSLVPGSYRVAAYSADAAGQPTEPSYCTIVVEGVTPTPPGPGPQPPPPDNDPLLAVLLPIFGADQSPTKKDDALKLAAVYDVASRTTVNDPALTTRAHLVATLVAAGRARVPMPGLQTIREKVAAELDAKVGTDSAAPLTAELRKAYADQFARLARIYKALGGG